MNPVVLFFTAIGGIVGWSVGTAIASKQKPGHTASASPKPEAPANPASPESQPKEPTANVQ
jgi:hypothetical protein